MRYRSQHQDFKIGPTPQSTGELDRMLRANRLARLGELAVFLYNELNDIAGFNTRRFITSLVNVTNKHAGFSYGVCPPPPDKCVPLECTWHFTFALSNKRYSEAPAAEHVMLNEIGVKTWFIGRSPFVTLAITPHEHFGLSNDSVEQQHVFNLVGTLTRAQMLNDSEFTVLDAYDSEQMEEQHLIDLSIIRSSYFMRPVTDALSIPFPFFVFNRQIWSQAPNLLVPAHMTDTAVLYWLLFMPYFKFGPYSKHLAETVTKKLQSGVLAARRLEGAVPQTHQELLYAALVCRGQVDSVAELQKINPLPSDADPAKQIRDLITGVP